MFRRYSSFVPHRFRGISGAFEYAEKKRISSVGDLPVLSTVYIKTGRSLLLQIPNSILNRICTVVRGRHRLGPSRALGVLVSRRCRNRIAASFHRQCRWFAFVGSVVCAAFRLAGDFACHRFD